MKKSNVKIVIYGKKGDAVNGKDCLLEVNGEAVYGQISTKIDMGIDEVATATVVFILPEIEYRDKT